MPPTASDIHARAYYNHDSNVYHPRQVTYMQERTTIMTPVYVIHSEWHICKSILLSLKYIPLMTCKHGHPSKSPVYTTHDEWHICKSLSPCPQYVSPAVNDMYARAWYPKPKSDNPLVHTSKDLQNPWSALGESYRFTPPCLQYVSLCKMHICKSTSLCL